MSELTTADLIGIERSLSVVIGNIRSLERSVDSVNGNVQVINARVGTLDEKVGDLYKEVDNLTQIVLAYVDEQKKANRLNRAETRLVQFRQELEQAFGHYEKVRKNAIGILQADDLGIVRKETMNTATEELMLSTPGYWLAPCIVAVAAWISDQPELAEKAMREGLRRNDEKTSLFFALICRRAGHRPASLRWVQRYLGAQDEEKLDRKTVVILDAFASGLLGADSEGVILKQIHLWLNRLEEKPGFLEQQTAQWSEGILLQKKPLTTDEYPYLKKYSKTWPILVEIMEGALLHESLLTYFMNIFEKEASGESVKKQLDEILDSLVTDYDDEELPLRKKEKFEQFVVDCNGDEAAAQKKMDLEESAFETHKDFTQLLTDAAMKPESSHASVATQKFSIALSKKWIQDAYRDVTAANRVKIPYEIEFQVESFEGKTADGYNEDELIQAYHKHVAAEKAAMLAKCTLNAFEKFLLIGGIVAAVLGLIMTIASQSGGGLVALIGGVGMVIYHFVKKREVDARRKSLVTQYDNMKESGTQIIRAILAEVVDFRRAFAKEDAKSEATESYLEQISTEHYVSAAVIKRQKKEKNSYDGESAFAEGLPGWDLVPPMVVTRR